MAIVTWTLARVFFFPLHDYWSMPIELSYISKPIQSERLESIYLLWWQMWRTFIACAARNCIRQLFKQNKTKMLIFPLDGWINQPETVCNRCNWIGLAGNRKYWHFAIRKAHNLPSEVVKIVVALADDQIIIYFVLYTSRYRYTYIYWAMAMDCAYTCGRWHQLKLINKSMNNAAAAKNVNK